MWCNRYSTAVRSCSGSCGICSLSSAGQRPVCSRAALRVRNTYRLLFEVHQAPEVGRRHAAALRLPDVAGHFGDADLTAHLPGLMSAFHLLQRLDDPPFREPALAYWRPPGRSLHGDLQFCLDPLYGEARP